MAFTFDVQPEALDIAAIPADAVDFSNTDEWTEDESKANAQYMLDALNDIKAKCESNSTSTFSGLIAPLAESGIVYFEDLLTPMASYEDISMLSDGISEAMVQLSNTYDANYAYVSDSTYNECSDLYDELDELYDEVAYAYEMDMDTYNELSDKAAELSDKAAALCEKIVEEAEAAREQAATQVTTAAGFWSAYEIVDGTYVASPDDWDFYSYIFIYADGTYYWNWNDEFTEGTWEADGEYITFYEDSGIHEFILSDGILSYEADAGVIVRYETY